MAKAVAIIASALCLLAVAASAQKLTLTGDVYCDPCRVQVKSKASKSVEGATVEVFCTQTSTGNITYSTTGKTDKEGKYSIPIEGVHGDYEGKEVCEVKVSDGKLAGCDEDMDTTLTGVDLTNNGHPTRYAKALGFMTPEVAPECKDVLEEMGIYDDEDEEEEADVLPQEQAEPEPAH